MKGYQQLGRVAPESERGSDWREFAACLDEDAELFFPVGTSGPAQLQVAEAKAVCRRCVVRSQCLDWVLETGADRGFGVWAGTSEKERRELRRELGYTTPPAHHEALRYATEDLLGGSTIQEVADRYGLSRNRAEELSAEVRRKARRAGAGTR